MPRPVALFRLLPLAALAAGLVWITWHHRQHAARLVAVSALPTWSVDAPAHDDQSPTGYADGRRHQLIAGGNRESMYWIRTTQHALFHGEDRRPAGESSAAAFAGEAWSGSALYRGWLGAVARLSGSGGIAVEVAARRADPWLHALLLVMVTVLSLRWFGVLSASLAALGFAFLFPLAANFTPGSPHHGSLFVACNAMAALLWLRGNDHAPRAWVWIVAAGVFATLGFSLNPATELPLLLGIAAAAAWPSAAAPETTGRVRTRRIWRLAGVAVAGMSGVAWLAVRWNGPHTSLLTAAPADRNLTAGGSWAADDISAWFAQPGAGAAVFALLLPTLLIGGAALWVTFKANRPERRRSVRLLLVPGLVAASIALARLSWWVVAQAILVVLLIAIGAELSARFNGRRQVLALVVFLLTLLPGAVLIRSPGIDAVGDELSEHEVLSSIERDLAQWLNQRTTPEERIALASPHLALGLDYYGGIHGVGTSDGDGTATDMAAIRIVSATSPAETLALLEARGVRFILQPSWDPLLENYVRIGRKLPPHAPLPEDTFLHALGRWALPSWLRPIPYPLPSIGGLDDASVTVFWRDDETSEALGLARLAEYFLEVGELDRAAGLRERLRRHTAEPGALPALGQIEAAVKDQAGLNRTLTALQAAVAGGQFEYEPWDRRLSLVVLLTQVQLMAPAREQLHRCMAEIDEPALRSLTPGSLLKLVALSRLHETPFPTAALEAAALALLPPNYRARLNR